MFTDYNLVLNSVLYFCVLFAPFVGVAIISVFAKNMIVKITFASCAAIEVVLLLLMWFGGNITNAIIHYTEGYHVLLLVVVLLSEFLTRRDSRVKDIFGTA